MPAGVNRQLPNTPSQQSGNPAPYNAATTEPSGNGAAPAASSGMAMGAPPEATGHWPDVPLAGGGEDLPYPDVWAIEPLAEHNDDSVFLQSSPPVPPPAYLLEAVQPGLCAWSAGALPSPEGCAPRGYPPIRRESISANLATQQCHARGSVSADRASLTEHRFHYIIR